MMLPNGFIVLAKRTYFGALLACIKARSERGTRLFKMKSGAGPVAGNRGKSIRYEENSVAKMEQEK